MFFIIVSLFKINVYLVDNNLNFKIDLWIENNGWLVIDLVIKDIIKLWILFG